MINLFLEGLWRSPSIICLDNLDAIIPDYPIEESNSVPNVHTDFLASIMKNFFENINQVGANSRVISISTCKRLSNVHKTVVGKTLKNNILFKKICDLEEINKNIFMASIDNCLKELEGNETIKCFNRNAILNMLESKFGTTRNLCGFDAVTLTKNAVLLSIKQVKDEGHLKDSVKIDFSDLDKSLVSSSYKFSNLHQKGKMIKVNFKDLYGLSEAKNKLKEIFIWPNLYPELFKKCPMKLQQSVLLYGLPGSGKSILALALSNEIKMNFKMIKGPELLSKYIGSSEENVRMLFDEAKRNQPILLFFDEFESLAPRRGHDNTGVTDRVVNQLLTEIDGVSSSEASGIYIVAASNRPDLIDPALLRPGRISGKIYCKLDTDIKDKIEALKFFLHKSELSVPNENVTISNYLESGLSDLQMLLSYSYADLFSVVKESENIAVMRYSKSDCSKCEIELEDFQKSLYSSRPSLSKDQIINYLNVCEAVENLKSRNLPAKFLTTLA